MQRARRFAESIIDTVRAPLVVLDRDLRVLMINRAFRQMFAVTTRETIGRPLAALGTGQWDRPDLHELLVDVATRYTELIDVEIEHEFPILGRRVMLLNARAMHSEHRSEAILLAIEDITERRAAERDLRALAGSLTTRTRQLEELNHELDQFTMSVSHDLRAPLRAIDGFAAVLDEDCDDQLPDEARQAIAAIRRNTTRMAQLIDDLLGFSRSSRQEMRLATVDMARLVRAVVDDAVALEPGRAIDVELGALPEVSCDANLIRQVWINLVGNAVKYTRRRERARIAIGGAVENGEVVYRIEDNGVGFDMAYAARLFGVFQRLHRADEFEGTGVGLALVQRIVRRHGGRVWADARVDGGASFGFALPRG